MDVGLLKRFTEEIFRTGKILSDNSITVTSGIATLTDDNPHGLSIGAKVVISGAANPLLNGFRVILEVPTTTTFTVTANSAANGADVNNPAIDYHVTGLEVVKGNSYSSSPPKPYITVRVPSDDGKGFPMPEIVPVDDNQVDQLIATYNIAQCELIFYSNDNTGFFSAQNLVKFFEVALGTDRAKQFQADNTFGVMQVRPRINADIALGDFFERRQILEFSVNHIFTLLETDTPFFNKDGLVITITEET